MSSSRRDRRRAPTLWISPAYRLRLPAPVPDACTDRGRREVRSAQACPRGTGAALHRARQVPRVRQVLAREGVGERREVVGAAREVLLEAQALAVVDAR